MLRSLADSPHLNQRRCCRARWSSTLAPTPRARCGSATSARCCRATTRTGGRTPSPRRRSAKLAILQFFFQILQIFGGLVLGCIKTKFCKNYVNASIPKEKTGALSFFESFILMQRLTVLSVIIHETTAHVMSSFDPLHALGLLVCIQRYPCRTRGFCFLHLF